MIEEEKHRFTHGQLLFKFIVVENFENEQTLVLLKTSHALADGIGVIHML